MPRSISPCSRGAPGSPSAPPGSGGALLGVIWERSRLGETDPTPSPAVARRGADPELSQPQPGLPTASPEPCPIPRPPLNPPAQASLQPGALCPQDLGAEGSLPKRRQASSRAACTPGNETRTPLPAPGRSAPPFTCAQEAPLDPRPFPRQRWEERREAAMQRESDGSAVRNVRKSKARSPLQKCREQEEGRRKILR